MCTAHKPLHHLLAPVQKKLLKHQDQWGVAVNCHFIGEARMISTRSGPCPEDFNHGWRMWTQHTDHSSPLQLEVWQAIFSICPFQTWLCYLPSHQQELSSLRKTQLSRSLPDAGLALLHNPVPRKRPRIMVKKLWKLACNQHKHKQQENHSRDLSPLELYFLFPILFPCCPRPFQINTFKMDALQRCILLLMHFNKHKAFQVFKQLVKCYYF